MRGQRQAQPIGYKEQRASALVLRPAALGRGEAWRGGNPGPWGFERKSWPLKWMGWTQREWRIWTTGRGWRFFKGWDTMGTVYETRWYGMTWYKLIWSYNVTWHETTSSWYFSCCELISWRDMISDAMILPNDVKCYEMTSTCLCMIWNDKTWRAPSSSHIIYP